MARTPAATGEAPPLIPREHLAHRIVPPDGSGPRVTTLVAPAGYGKTALLRSVAADHGETGGETGGQAGGDPRLFVSLSDCEHHPALFIDLLAASVRARLPQADLRPLYLLKKASPPGEFGLRLPRVLSRVLEPLVQGPVTLLVDDLQHAAPGEPLAELLGGLLRAEPQRMRFVLASRRQVPVDLSPFRQRGELVELTGPDLAFTKPEVAALLAAALGRPVPDLLADRIWDRTRGWAGVVGLLCNIMRDRSDDEVARLVEGLTGEEKAIVDFVVERLLGEHPAPVGYFMKVISVLDRVSLDAAEFLFREPEAGRGAQSRYLISLPPARIPEYLEKLERTQVLLPAGRKEGSFEFNPLVGETLRKLLAREDPRVFREAHRRAAAWHLEKEGVVDTACLDHMVAAAEHDRVLQLLEEDAERFFAAGYHRQLARWLLELESHYATLPFWASYYVGRIYTALGEWDRARAYLDRCKDALAQQARREDAWRWHPRLCLGYAAMYHRRGMHAEASTYCRRGLDYLRQARRGGEAPRGHETELALSQLELLNLLGTVKMESGGYEKARQDCEEARDVAREAGLQREEAIAQKNLGLIAMRRGDVKSAGKVLAQGLVRADSEVDPELHATIAFLLGQTHRMAGRFEEALGLIESALARIVDTGRPETVVTMLAAEGELHAARGETEDADRSFRQALRLLEGVGDPKVKAEVLSQFVIHLARSGRPDEASLVVDRASHLVDGLLRSEVHLVALHAEALAEYHAARGDLSRAIKHLEAAQDRYARLGAEYHMARLDWRAALWHNRLFVAGDEDTPESVMAHLADASDAAWDNGYLLDVDPSLRELLHVGVAYGEDEMPAVCLAALRRLDGPAAVSEGAKSLSEEAQARYRDYRRRAELADDFVISTREGRRGANARQVEEVLHDHGDEALCLVVHDQLLVNRGEEISLAEKRVILPLLLHFLKHPDDVFTMEELADEVWEKDAGESAMQTKVKVAISRLRALLGKDREYVLTTRVEADDGRTVAYGLAPDIDFYLVERIEEES